MRPSPPPPALGDFPSSPSSVWSCTRSVAQYPPTPTDSMETIPRQKSDSCVLSEDDIHVFLRNRGRWENMYDRFESSPPLRPCLPPISHDRAADHFSWESTHSAIIDPTELDDPSRCSLLIHEVSLLVGLAPDDDFPSPDDSSYLVPDRSKHEPDILPLTLTPTKSLASRKYTNIPTLAGTNAVVLPCNIPSIFANDPNPTLHNDKGGSTDIVTPPARHKCANSVRPSISPLRRQGQVFHFDPPLSDEPPHWHDTADLDETFVHPREPPPKPTVANRCSSLDRLERSLQKLEAHAPRHHRKSQSEERPPHHVAQRQDKRPSLPPPRQLRKGHSSHEIVYRTPSRPDPPPPVPRPIPVRPNVVPPICRADPVDKEVTPGSFMDMDIPCAEKASQKQRTSFGQLTGKEKMKSLVRAAKTASRGFIAWGKNLTGSTKQETTAFRHSRL